MLLHSVTTLVTCLSATIAWAEEPRVPLKIEFPEEVLAGTPPDVLAMLFPDLEMPKPQEPAGLLVPEGTVNVALGKPITASDENPILGELPFVTDGQKEGSETTFLELGPGAQWVQIDLQKRSAI